MNPSPDTGEIAGAVRLWLRLPAIVRAVLTGGIVAAAGTVPWALLATANTKYWSSVPWALIPTILYLWFFWWYVRGGGWPQSTSGFRRTYCRANRVQGEVWGAAILAGVLGLISLVLFQSVMNRLVRLPQQEHLDISRYPPVTVFMWIVMSAIVAGVAEETSFRGYMQKQIEERHGPAIAILVTGALFGFAHFSHPEVGLILMPYYIVVAAVYGALAYFTNSIYPSMVLHAGGNILSTLDLIGRGRSEWQASPGASPLIWKTGVDASFWISVIGLLAVGAGALLAYSGLRRVARSVAGAIAPV
jgi:membrane protease YdiL (CAAX protease family)